ncbi:S1C family serine protease [Pseudonocardia sp. N23]|uniref:S1C family serine protease n=1 Tax=Pseudonocardia sp. N23 TaxID=1987376 RepID=UPI000C02F6D8|nr:trypsin-like peptidase domain-containing protein [Pseudonocardia sp. N23]GAY08203.1 peptidase S1 and S6, chymotrypsin/Hap [Pseudonocardia sp. N23]
MTDEQRGYGRPDGDADPAGRPPTEHTSAPPTGEPATPDTPAAAGATDTSGTADRPAGDPPTTQFPAAWGTRPTEGPTAGPATGPGHDTGAWQRPAWGGHYGTPGPGAPGAAGGPGHGAHAQHPGGTTTMAAPALAPHQDQRKKSRPMVGIVAAALIAGLVGGGAGFGAAYAVLDHGGSGVTLSSSPASASNAAATNGTVAAAAAKAMPSTVDIRVALAQGTAEGSGVVLTADGNVLTNNHVVAGSNGQITVTLADGSQHTAKVVGTSPSYDLAVIKLDGVSGLTPATLGRTGDVQVGQQVVAIGSPQGLTGTVTTGIVSALNRTVAVQGEDGSGVVYNGLQTDAPINQGNSGGPLVNLDGQVVGINSAIATAQGSSGSVGLGFAIPVDQAKRVAQEIIDSGHATKPVLGVQGSTSGGSSSSDQGGATIAAVQDGSPAAAAGLKAGDVVTKVGNATVGDFSDLVARIGAYAPGDKVTLTIGTGDSARTVDVTLGSQVDQAATTSTGGSDPGGPGRSGGNGSGGSGDSGNPLNPFGGNPFGRGGN